MTERDYELAKQADNEFTGEIDDDLGHHLVGTEAIQKFADLIRADEREALEKIDWTAVMREGSLVTWADAQELGDRVLATIRARGNT